MTIVTSRPHTSQTTAATPGDGQRLEGEVANASPELIKTFALIDAARRGGPTPANLMRLINQDPTLTQVGNVMGMPLLLSVLQDVNLHDFVPAQMTIANELTALRSPSGAKQQAQRNVWALRGLQGRLSDPDLKSVLKSVPQLWEAAGVDGYVKLLRNANTANEALLPAH